jgi:hypothetical protein
MVRTYKRPAVIDFVRTVRGARARLGADERGRWPHGMVLREIVVSIVHTHDIANRAAPFPSQRTEHTPCT